MLSIVDHSAGYYIDMNMYDVNAESKWPCTVWTTTGYADIIKRFHVIDFNFITLVGTPVTARLSQLINFYTPMNMLQVIVIGKGDVHVPKHMRACT